MEVNIAKVLALFVLCLCSIFIGLLPATLKEYNLRVTSIYQTVSLCYGAGLLIATSIVYMLPEVEHHIFFLAPIVFCGGFLFVYLADEVLHFCFGDAIPHHNHNHEDYQLIVDQPPPVYGSTSHSEAHTDQEVDSESQTQQESATHHSESGQRTLVGIIGMLAALLIHSFLEGLAIGIQATVVRVMILFNAVMSHKLVFAFRLGVELSAPHDSNFKHHLLAILVFSAGSAIGIAVGIGLVDLLHQLSLSIVQGIAAGALLYVALREVLSREEARCHQTMNNKYTGLLQFVSVSVGFSVMTYMKIKFPE